MVYVLDVSPLEWDRIAVPTQELGEKLSMGVPLQQSDIPVAPQLKGRFLMPDVGVPTQFFLFVSSRGKEVFDALAPGCFAYFPLDLQVPSSMKPAGQYWFFEVLPRAQLIDWERSETYIRRAKSPNGREVRGLKAPGVWGQAPKFKEVTPDLPMVWRESDVLRLDVHYWQNKWPIFMRDSFWQGVSIRFPGQLAAVKVAAG